MAGDSGELWACREIRKHIAWYLKGFAVGPALRSALGLVESMAELDDLLDRLDTGQPFPVDAVGVPRGRTGSPRQVALPDGWLADELDGHVLAWKTELSWSPIRRLTRDRSLSFRLGDVSKSSPLMARFDQAGTRENPR